MFLWSAKMPVLSKRQIQGIIPPNWFWAKRLDKIDHLGAVWRHNKSLYALIWLKEHGIIQSIPNDYDYISPCNGPWSERIHDYGKLEDLVDDII